MEALSISISIFYYSTKQHLFVFSKHYSLWRYAQGTKLLTIAASYQKGCPKSDVRCVSTISLCQVTGALIALWRCQFQAWIKEEGNANHLRYETVSLNSNQQGMSSFAGARFGAPLHGQLDMCKCNYKVEVSATLPSRVHSFSQAISIAPLQVHCYSEALPTQHGYYVGVSRRAPQATASEGLVQGPCVAVRAGFEPVTLRTKGAESTKEPPRPTTG